MTKRNHSEIRDSTVRALRDAVANGRYRSYLQKVKLTKVRSFVDEIVSFDFPVTALVGTNGGGKSTILGAAALAYKSIRPARFFPKSSIGDESMSNWSIAYDMIEREIEKNSLLRAPHVSAIKNGCETTLLTEE